MEGFERTGERTARVPGLGLWEAYTGLRGRWIAPDPLQAYLESILREDDASFDLEAFCALPRRAAEPPGAEEVREALVKALTPADNYRLTWAVPSEGGGVAVAPPPAIR